MNPPRNNPRHIALAAGFAACEAAVMKSRVPAWVMALLLAVGPAAAQSRTNSPAPASFATFQNIPDRNIFNARRAPGRSSEEPPPPPRRERTVETFSLLGTLNYEKGPVAFFESSSPAHPKSAKVEQTIAGCKITGIEQNVVRLEANGQPLELRVGYQMRREDDGPWKMFEADRPSDYGSSYTPPPTPSLGSSRFGSSSSSSRDSRFSSSSSSRTSSFGNESPAESAMRRMREQDRNGDGKISLEEADSRLRPRFAEMDKNGDGFVDLAEYTAYYASRNGSSFPGTSTSSSGTFNNFTLPPGSQPNAVSPGSVNNPSSSPSAPPPPSSGGSSESDVLRRLLEQRARENR